MTDDVSVVPSICVFDVNETLLDIESIAPLFQRLFGDRKVLREWFGQLVLYSNAITLSGPYTTFFALGQGVLKMLGSIHDVSVQQADIEELRMRMLTMPAHSDVPAGLKQLKDAGFRLVTLTNSPPDSQTSPLKHAGIDGWFEKSGFRAPPFDGWSNGYTRLIGEGRQVATKSGGTSYFSHQRLMPSSARSA